jgi:hypothetical protein
MPRGETAIPAQCARYAMACKGTNRRRRRPRPIDPAANLEVSAIQRLNLPFCSAITLAEGARKDLESAGVAGGSAAIESRLDKHRRGERS